MSAAAVIDIAPRMASTSKATMSRRLESYIKLRAERDAAQRELDKLRLAIVAELGGEPGACFEGPRAVALLTGGTTKPRLDEAELRRRAASDPTLRAHLDECTSSVVTPLQLRVRRPKGVL